MPRRQSSFAEWRNSRISLPPRQSARRIFGSPCEAAHLLRALPSDRESRSGGQIFLAQIHVDVELIAGEWPMFFLLGDERRHASVHDVDLHFRMRRAVRSFLAPAHVPVVADQSLRRDRVRLRPSLRAGPPPDAHDQVHNTVVFWRLPEVVQRCFQFLHGQVFHGWFHG